MQSKQIQLFGVVGTAVLILFTVIFFGKDFYQLYLKYTQGTTLPALSDEQIVMEADAMKNLQERLDKEAAPMLKEYHPQNESKKSSVAETEEASLSQTETVTPLHEKLHKKASEEELSAVLAEKNEAKEAKADVFSLKDINARLRGLMREGSFFRHSMALSKANKEILDQVAATIKEIPEAFYVVVEGHTEAGVSRSTSETMALRVKQYLAEKLPGVKIESVGYGNEYPVIDEAANKENRRVEILIRRGEK